MTVNQFYSQQLNKLFNKHDPILAWYQSIFYTYNCKGNTQHLENVSENKDLSYFENITIPF